MSFKPTNLSPTQLDELRARARREESRFVDPAQMRRVERILADRPVGWVAAVLGHDARSLRQIYHGEMTLLELAVEAEPLAPVDPAVEERRLARQAKAESERLAVLEEARRQMEAWEELRALLPVPTIVCHNWTLRHTPTYVLGAEHIVALEPFEVGRLRRRANDPLCWTPSRSHDLRGVSIMNPRDPVLDAEGRPPTCKACLRIAHRLAQTVDSEEEAT